MNKNSSGAGLRKPVSVRWCLGVLVTLTVACGQVADAKDKAIFDTDDTTIVKRSRNNICHVASDPAFAQTQRFKAYRTLQDCLDSGGKRPRN